MNKKDREDLAKAMDEYRKSPIKEDPPKIAWSNSKVSKKGKTPGLAGRRKQTQYVGFTIKA